MPTRLRVLLAAVVLACATMVLGAPAATAVSAVAAPTTTCTPQSVEESTKAAEVIFIGTVKASARKERPDGQPGFLFDQNVQVSTVYVGSVTEPTVTVQTDKTPQVCGLGRLVSGTTYVFFVKQDGDVYVAKGGAGTAPATAVLVDQVEELRGSGHPPVKPEKETAEFTPVSTGEPGTFTRAAAPGAALVLIGLLGLVLLRGRGRRTP